MPLDDIIGLRKLLELLGNGAGYLLSPIRDRLLTSGTVDRIDKLTDAAARSRVKGVTVEYKDDKLTITADQDSLNAQMIDQDLAQQTLAGILQREAKQQANQANTIAAAIPQLASGETASEDPVDADWFTRYLNTVQDISDERVQLIWGKVLADEIKEPGSYSLKTLDVLKNFSQKEAEIFKKVGNVILTSDDGSFIVNHDNYEFLAETLGIPSTDIFLLQELGILLTGDLQVHLGQSEETRNKSHLLINGKLGIHIERIPGTPDQSLPIIRVTQAGQELVGLLEVQPDLRYIKRVATLLRRNGVTIRYGTIKAMKGTQVGFDRDDFQPVPEEN
jgi:hypothetical protein